MERRAVERGDLECGLECGVLKYGNCVLCNVGLWSVSVELWSLELWSVGIWSVELWSLLSVVLECGAVVWSCGVWGFGV